MNEWWLIPLFAVLNRFSGGGVFWDRLSRDHGGFLRGRPIYYSFVVLAFCLTPLYGWPGFLLALSFLLWRLPGWYGSHDMGSYGHTTGRDFLVMFARGFVAFPVFLYAQYHGMKEAIILLPMLALLIALCYLVGIKIFTEKIKTNGSGVAEWLTGIVWGGTAILLIEGVKV